MGDEYAVIPYLSNDQRLYIATGRPWDKALAELDLEERLGQYWHIKDGCRRGDMILTILATTPRVFFCAEWSRRDSRSNGKILVDDSQTITFENGISVAAVEEMIGYKLRGRSVHEGSYANGIIATLNVKLANPTPWFMRGVAVDDKPAVSPITALWRKDSTSIVGRNDSDGGGFSTRVVLYAPIDPKQMIKTLTTIVNTTFGGDLEAALRVIIDDHGWWELLEPSTTAATESSRIIRERDIPPEIEVLAIPGVGLALNGISGNDLPDYQRLGDVAHGEALWGYFFDPDGTITVLQTDIDDQIWEPWAVYTPDETGLHPC